MTGALVALLYVIIAAIGAASACVLIYQIGKVR